MNAETLQFARLRTCMNSLAAFVPERSMTSTATPVTRNGSVGKDALPWLQNITGFALKYGETMGDKNANFTVIYSNRITSNH